MWPMDLLFFKPSPVKQYSFENDFSGVFDAFAAKFSCLLKICMYLPRNGSKQSLQRVSKAVWSFNVAISVFIRFSEILFIRYFQFHFFFKWL